MSNLIAKASPNAKTINLAHGQEIVTHDWPQIIRMTRNMEEWKNYLEEE